MLKSTSGCCYKLAANILKAHPEVSLVADLTDVHAIKGGHICVRLEAKMIEANFTACTLNAEWAVGWISLGVKPAFFR